jgi:transcriptional regulator with XRE-family HTH domain
MSIASLTVFSFEVTATLARVGQLLSEARKVRGDSESVAAARLGVSRPTWRSIEAGDTNVRIGVYLQAMILYGMEERVLHLAARDPLTEAAALRQVVRKARTRAPHSARINAKPAS